MKSPTDAGQEEIIDFLSSPVTHGGLPVERIDTHASVIFLAGTRAWKLKRAVHYEYLDFSTLERRRVCCDAEVRLNRRTAPSLYRGITPVTREPDGSLRLGGGGTPVEWIIEMARFNQDDLLDRRATRGCLELSLMRPLGSAIASFHHDAARRPDHGGAAGMSWVVNGNRHEFSADRAGLLEPALRRQVIEATAVALTRHSPQLDARRRAGFVRQCHGDLHLRNLVLIDDVPVPFDAVEFNDEIACIDVLYDLAFLLMDLSSHHLPRHANAVLNGYLAATDDLDGLSLLPLFLSCRAAVRAKVTLTEASLQQEAQQRQTLIERAAGYLDVALQMLEPPRPCLVAVGGLSGSGKSSLARALAPGVGVSPGAIVLRSDEIRKRLCGVPDTARLPAEGYASTVSQRVYATLVEQAETVVRTGHAALVDAACLDPADRSAIEQVAARASVPFVGVWLEAPEQVLIDRVTRRTGDASDADAAVVRGQHQRDTGAISWHRLDARMDTNTLVQTAARLPDWTGGFNSARLD
ncbi:MAG: AAA family ATPase [Vicinamibacterales bacterium]